MQSVTLNQSDWIRDCIRASTDDSFFEVFRQSESFQRVTEGSLTEWGEYHLTQLLKYPLFHSILDSCVRQDLIGSPLKQILFQVAEKQHRISPTSLRYLRNSFNILELFGNALGNCAIHEIGGGMVVT